MLITNEVIESLNPCPGRYDNYLKFYKDKSHTIKQFMGLKNITHADKVWVALRLMDKSKICFIGADIAESVLPIFNATNAATYATKNQKIVRTILLKYLK